MSSLSIEMGLSRRRVEPPPIPDRLSSRNDMTLAQKQRLAVMAKMGVGPEAVVASMTGNPAQLMDAISQSASQSATMPGHRDRRAELLDRERRLKDAAKDDDGEVFQRVTPKRPRPAPSGMSRLGPVMPREGGPQVPVVPAQVPVSQQWTLKISKDTAERAARGVEAVEAERAEEEEDSSEDSDEDVKQEKDALSVIKREREKRETEKRAVLAKLEHQRQLQRQQQQQQQSKKKKKKRKGGGDEEADEWQDADSDDEECDAEHDRRLAQENGIFGKTAKQTMVIDSVKGKVSTANKGMTDADLERRFMMNESMGDGGALMSEEQVLKMIRREKQEKGAPNERGGASVSRRVQRELDEWADKKAQQRARVKSPHRFERMVIARK